MYNIYSTAHDNLWRFTLGKSGQHKLLIIGLNPSTATNEQSDVTIAKVDTVAKHNGYDGFVMLNLYPVRSTDYNALSKAVDNTAFDDNLTRIERLISDEQQAVAIWAAWGNSIIARPYFQLAAIELIRRLQKYGVTWQHFGTLTALGHPRHPSRLNYSWSLSRFDAISYADGLSRSIEGKPKPRQNFRTIQLLETTLRQLVAIDKDSYYAELVQKITVDKEFTAAVLTLSQRVNRSSSYFDEEYLHSLSEDELLALTRVLTWLDGKIKGFTLNSVAPVPSLIKELELRDYKHYETLVDWVFKNRTNTYLPFGSMFGADVKSLKEYQILTQENKLKIKKIELDAEFRRLEKLKRNYSKATAELRNAIRRNDFMAYGSLIRKGAELYAMDSDGKTLAEKIESKNNSHHFTKKNNNNTKSKDEMQGDICVRDSTDQVLTIRVNATADDCNRIDCASITARYDHGFGWSKLYRFFEDKDDQEIKNICDWVNTNDKSSLLPPRSSNILRAAFTSSVTQEVQNNLRVIVTPIVKGNSLIEKDRCKRIMSDIIDLSQSDGVQSQCLLITQFGFMLSYRDQHFDGIVEAIKERQTSSFLNLRKILFEVDSKYELSFFNQLSKRLIN